MIDGVLNTLLLELYSCPADYTRWPTVLDRLRQALRVRCAAIQLLSTVDERINVKWVARDSESEASRGHHDPFISGDQNPRLLCKPPFEPHTSTIFMRDWDGFAKRNRELAQLHERLADLGLGSCLSARVTLSAAERLVLVLHRDINDRSEYSHHDEALVAAVMPHLRQAVSLSAQLESVRNHNNDLRDAVDRMSFGLVLCDANARPSWANRAARHTFSKRDGLWLSRDQLTTGSPTDTETLRRSIAEVASGVTGATRSQEQWLLVSRSTVGSALQVVVVPLEPEPGKGHVTMSRRQVLVLFSKPSATPILPPDVVAKLFALSPAESRLTVALCQGHTVNDYAAAHGVSVGTARFQLKQVLAKTQAPRQSDLIRRVCTSVVAHARHAEA